MKRSHVLLIEDDEAIRDIIAYVLLTEGLEVITAEKTLTNAEIIAYRPDLIVLDEWIDAREGSLLCQEIKALHQLAHVPGIIISTSASIADLAKSCKADGFVQKPFDIDQLLAEIKRCLALQKLVDQPQFSGKLK